MRRALALLGIVALGLGPLGCIRYQYRVEAEATQDLEQVRQSPQLWARELVVSFTPPPEWEYPAERWTIVEAELQKWYAAWIVARVQSADRQVTMLEPGQEADTGVVLEVDLTKIEKGSHGWTGTGVGMTKNEAGWATIIFREAGSGRPLYESEITMESAVGSSSGGFGFKDRVKFLMWHCANAIRDLMEQGALGEGLRNQSGPV